MDSNSYKTKTATPSTIEKKWFVIDGENQVVGRLATQVAMMLRGKHKASFTPHMDCGDNIVIINAEKVKFTGSKLTDKRYFSHTGYPGGQKRVSPASLFEKKPVAVMEKAVRGMLPKNKLGNALFKNLYVYVGSEHPHAPQKPTTFTL